MDLDEAKEVALRDLEKYTKNTWYTYGVTQDLLVAEMQTWFWLVIELGGKEQEVLMWKGIGITLDQHIEKRINKIRECSDLFGISKALDKAKNLIYTAALYLWSLGKCQGPNAPRLLMNKAAKAEQLASYFDRTDREDAAKTQRERAELLRRKAAGEDVEIKTRRNGAIATVRAAYAKLVGDGKAHARSEFIAVGVAAGIHPGTCAVQYAWWKKQP